MNNSSNHDITLQGFVNDIKQIINTARTNAVRSVDFCRVQMYWAIGQRIVEKEQQGKERADYGTYLIKNLAKEIEPEFGSGFGERQLKFCRQFYNTYPIRNALRSQLNWSQYRMLIQIPDPDKREYYELEAVNEGWSGRQLERQINSTLYEQTRTTQPSDLPCRKTTRLSLPANINSICQQQNS